MRQRLRWDSRASRMGFVGSPAPKAGLGVPINCLWSSFTLYKDHTAERRSGIVAIFDKPCEGRYSREVTGKNRLIVDSRFVTICVVFHEFNGNIYLYFRLEFVRFHYSRSGLPKKCHPLLPTTAVQIFVHLNMG